MSKRAHEQHLIYKRMLAFGMLLHAPKPSLQGLIKCIHDQLQVL